MLRWQRKKHAEIGDEQTESTAQVRGTSAETNAEVDEPSAAIYVTLTNYSHKNELSVECIAICKDFCMPRVQQKCVSFVLPAQPMSVLYVCMCVEL